MIVVDRWTCGVVVRMSSITPWVVCALRRATSVSVYQWPAQACVNVNTHFAITYSGRVQYAIPLIVNLPNAEIALLESVIETPTNIVPYYEA
jgi:hypothetical protein